MNRKSHVKNDYLLYAAPIIMYYVVGFVYCTCPYANSLYEYDILSKW